MTDDIFFHEIADIQDDLLLPWLDLYEEAFPVSEKVPVSDHLRALKDRAQHTCPAKYLLAALDEQNALVGMARWDMERDCSAAYLIYIAVSETQRSRGIGGRLWKEIVRRVQAEQPALKAIIFEVERPDQTHTVQDRHNAERRIQFYKRQGAALLRGIHYLQSVPGQTPMPMHIMAYPLQYLDAESVYEMADCLLGINRTEETLALDYSGSPSVTKQS